MNQFKTQEKDLKDKVELNSIEKKVDIRNKAIGNYNGKTFITNDKDEANYLVQNNDNQNKSLSEVEISKLDEELTISQNFFLKIDVEGFEYQVLKGQKNTFIRKINWCNIRIILGRKI